MKLDKFDIAWWVFHSLIFGFLSWSVLSEMIANNASILISSAFAIFYCSSAFNSTRVGYLKKEIEQLGKALKDTNDELKKLKSND